MHMGTKNNHPLLKKSTSSMFHNITPRKSLGQNFLIDQDIAETIVYHLRNINSCNVLELGAGTGSLTRILIQDNILKLIAVEKDQECCRILSTLQDQHKEQVTIINADMLTIDIPSLFNDKFKIISNLPYNISTAFLMRIFSLPEYPTLCQGMILMLQREVVDRIIATPGSSSYGRLSVMCQYHNAIYKILDVPPEAFRPIPRVHSSVIKITPLEQPVADISLEKLANVTRVAFAGKRKKISNSLRKLYPDINMVCEKIGISHALRADEISVVQYCMFAKHLSEYDKNP